MKCPIDSHENAELLLAYCARKLDPEIQAILERHLAVCPECREFQKNQEAVWQALDAWEAMPVSTDFDRRLYRRIDQEQLHASWWSRLVRPFRPVIALPLMSRSVPLAAAACLGVQVGSWGGMKFGAAASAKWLKILMAAVLFIVSAMMFLRGGR